MGSSLVPAGTELGLLGLEANIGREDSRSMRPAERLGFARESQLEGTVVLRKEATGERRSSAPTDAQQPALRGRNQWWSGLSLGCRAVLVRHCRRDGLAAPKRVYDEVLQHICDRLRDLGRRTQDMLVEAVREYLPCPTHQPVEPACDPDRQSLQATREAHLIGRLHDQVEVISLDREVDQTEASAIAGFRECRRELAETAAAAKIPDVRQHAPGHVDRMVFRQDWPGHVRYAGPIRLRLSPRASPLPTPGGQPQRKLFRSCHLESA